MNCILMHELNYWQVWGFHLFCNIHIFETSLTFLFFPLIYFSARGKSIEISRDK